MTLNDLKLLLNYDLTDTSQDTRLQLLLDSSYVFIENEINYPLTEKTITEKKSGSGNHFLSLKYYPVNSIVSVKETDKYFSNTIDITSSIDYTYKRDEGLLYRKDGFFYKEGIYEVVYKAGFISIPHDLEYALRLVAISLNAHINYVKDGVDRISTPDGSFTYRNEILTPALNSILDKYRKIYL